MEDLYIDDDDFSPYYTKIMEVHNALETRLGNIVAELEKACGAVSDGDFHTNLVAFHSTLVETQGDLAEFTSYVIEKANAFLVKMQALDNVDIVV